MAFDKAELCCGTGLNFPLLQEQVIDGPPPRPLPPYQVGLADNGPGQPATIVVSRE